MAERYALIDNATNAWLGGPFATAPTPAAGQRVVACSLYYPDSAAWSASNGGGWVELLSEADCLAAIDACAATLRSGVQTIAPGMADLYRRKMAEVAALNTLGGTTATILSALKLLTAAQQQATYPFLYAEMQAAGLADLTVARDRVVAASTACAAPLAAIELYRRKAKIAIRAATSLAAKNAVVTTAVWPS